ncbi:transcriptional regulator [Bifidobacterium sp. SO4]|uniref:helix-turn-helix domain-containing transcriptional regulator n=1 Tax=Bifidobacterium sp. SO4 TaxID=2809030 RepID=UPI001F0AEC83|nr:transcriptional regulator [Bifidobacterium sp. SO4]
MDTPKFTDWHSYDYLENEEDIRLYLEACAEIGDPELMKAAREDAAKARGIISKRRGASFESERETGSGASLEVSAKS